MSFDDYANHIYQKNRLAIALAVIKSKPPNITTKNYIDKLKSNINHKMDDDDITVCSDDFIIDDDDMNGSVTILKDFELGNIGDEMFKDFDDDGNAGGEKLPTVPENLSQDSQVTYYNSSQSQSTTITADPLLNVMIGKENNINNQKYDIELSIPTNIVNKNKEINDERNSNKKIDSKCTNMTYSNKNDDKNSSVNEKDSNYKAVATSNENMDLTYYDSQKTQLYSVHGFTQNYTHFSPSQNDIVIPNKYIYGINKNKDDNIVQNKDSTKETNAIVTNMNDFDNDSHLNNTGLKIVSKTNEKPTNEAELEYTQTMNVFSHNNDVNFDSIRNNETIFNRQNSINKHTENLVNTQNTSQYFVEMQSIDENNTTHYESIENNMNNNIEIVEMDTTGHSITYNQTIDHYNSQNFNKLTKSDAYIFENDNIKQLSSDKYCLPMENNTNNNKEIVKTAVANDTFQVKPIADNFNTQNINEITKVNENTLQSENLTQNDSNQNNSRIEMYRIVEEESAEIISYKVLEEFNKVKTFLKRNRRMSTDGYSTDSGYRSDSQIRNSNRSALQLSGNWLNQSGCCLFNYIMQCPLVISTRDITNEIAQVLSQLIDRLHEEEKYPSFLEDLLETVDILLRQVYEGDSSEDGEFLKKDENIQRILYLNKSIHIQKHCIEKISQILEKFHSHVTETDSTYELSNIDQIENVAYIFHILEMLLKKYLKNREILSQNSTQNTQEDEKIFKKSSITEIWRKKWNPSQKVFEGSCEKKCVLKTCSDILNKIVVDCVSSYSLVAYSALKCFNSMQN